MIRHIGVLDISLPETLMFYFKNYNQSVWVCFQSVFRHRDCIQSLKKVWDKEFTGKIKSIHLLHKSDDAKAQLSGDILSHSPWELRMRLAHGMGHGTGPLDDFYGLSWST